MNTIFFVGIMLLNVAISVWNCYAIGSMWKDIRSMGTGFDKALIWSGIIQSTVGFSMPILILLTMMATSYFSSGSEPDLTPEQAAQFMEGIFSLWYVVIIFPILASGTIIWIHSLREAYRNRDFASFAVAGWNSYAQISNTLSALNNVTGAFGNVRGLFGSIWKGNGQIKGKLILSALIIVPLSIFGGFFITIRLIHYFSNKTSSSIEEYAEHIRDR